MFDTFFPRTVVAPCLPSADWLLLSFTLSSWAGPGSGQQKVRMPRVEVLVLLGSAFSGYVAMEVDPRKAKRNADAWT